MAGAKDDRLDAYVVADALRTNPHCFRAVHPDTAQVTELRRYTRMLEELIAITADSRISCANRSSASPRMACAGGRGRCAVVLDLVGEDNPTNGRETSATNDGHTTLAGSSNPPLVSGRRAWLVLDAPKWTPAEGTWAAVHAHVEVLLARLRLLQRQRATCEAGLDRLLRQCAEGPEGEPGGHRDVSILLSLPGVGRKAAAAMLAMPHGNWLSAIIPRCAGISVSHR